MSMLKAHLKKKNKIINIKLDIKEYLEESHENEHHA